MSNYILSIKKQNLFTVQNIHVWSTMYMVKYVMVKIHGHIHDILK